VSKAPCSVGVWLQVKDVPKDTNTIGIPQDFLAPLILFAAPPHPDMPTVCRLEVWQRHHVVLQGKYCLGMLLKPSRVR